MTKNKNLLFAGGLLYSIRNFNPIYIKNKKDGYFNVQIT